MKKIVVIIALTIFLKPIFPVLEYAVNYDYITSVLCVNKDKPMMHCNGKCHLMKQLAKAAENEKPSAPNKKNTTEETDILFCMQESFFEIPKSYAIPITRSNTYYNNLYCYNVLSTVLHPPIG